MPARRIAIGGIEHETAGLLPGETPMSVFDRRRVTAGELLERSAEANTVVDGFLHGARQRGWDIAGLLWIKGTSGPPASRETFDAMLADSPAEWQRAVEKHRPRFAVIYEDSFNYLSKMCLLRMREEAFEMIQVA